MLSKDVQQWLNLEILKRSKRAKRLVDPTKIFHPYVHFDARISLNSAVSKIDDKAYILKHRFLPFIRRKKGVRSLSKATKDYCHPPRTSPATKARPLDRPSHLDAFIYSWYCHLLSIPYEKALKRAGINECVIAYRSLGGKGNIDFASDIFEKIKEFGECTVICLDVADFFGSLNHEKLKMAWSSLLEVKALPEDHYRIFRSLTAYSFVEEEKLYKFLGIDNWKTADNLSRLCPNEKEFYKRIKDIGLIEYHEHSRKRGVSKENERGIPQGSQLSGLLSNLYMFNFDKVVNKQMLKIGGIYRRYSDDILLIIPPTETTGISKIVRDELNELKLQIKDEKTDEVIFQKTPKGLESFKLKNGTLKLHSVQYLGIQFNGKDTYLRPQTISKKIRTLKWALKRQKAIARKNSSQVSKRKLYRDHSPLNRHKFFGYTERAKKTLKSNGIRKQEGKIFKKLNKEIQKINELL